MSRLRRLRPVDLSADQRGLYDDIVDGPRATGPQLFELRDSEGRLNGPFNAMLFSPPVGGAMQALGAAVRYGSVLTGRIREAAILAVAAHWDSAFEQYAHEPSGRRAGLDEDEIAALRRQQPPPFDEAAEQAAIDVTLALLRDNDLDDAAYAVASSALGERGLFELLTLVGYYSTLALQLRVFRVAVPIAPSPVSRHTGDELISNIESLGQLRDPVVDPS